MTIPERRVFKWHNILNSNYSPKRNKKMSLRMHASVLPEKGTHMAEIYKYEQTMELLHSKLRKGHITMEQFIHLRKELKTNTL